MCIKSEVKEICWKLTTDDHSYEAFLLTPQSWPNGLSLPKGYVHACWAHSLINLTGVTRNNGWLLRLDEEVGYCGFALITSGFYSFYHVPCQYAS